MSTLSPLQTLPLHVVERIVDNVVSSIRLGVTDRGVDHSWLEYLRPLMKVCHNFRAIAYPRFCRNAKLELSSALFRQRAALYKRTGRRDASRPPTSCLGYPAYHLAKDLEVELDERAIYTGKALRMLSYEPYDDCAFPLVRKLTLSFAWDGHDGSDGYYDQDEYGTVEQNVAVNNVSAFVQWFKQKVPMVSEIRIQPGASVHGSGVVASNYFGDLISQLYQLVDRVDLDSYDGSEVTMYIQFEKTSHLTHISYTGSGLGSHFTKLIRLNAPTLQSLVIVPDGEFTNIRSFTKDFDCSSVVFPCLLKLKLDIEFEGDMLQQPVHSGPAMFPQLRNLFLRGCYKLDTFVFFRGNSATLESLDLKLDSSTVAMIRRYNVFTPTSHPRLRCVRTSYQFNLIPGLFTTAAEAMQFSLGIGPTAPVREICEPSSINNLLPAYSLLGQHTCIQVLLLTEAKPELWDVLSLIESLPLLSDLHTSSARLGSMPAGVKKPNLPAYICSKYSPMGKRFRCWHFHGNVRGSELQIAHTVLLLALACPAFDYALQHTSNQSSFERYMLKAIASDMFKDHAQRLWRFL
ncbi:hypothetical protein GGI08_001769 [Coemansia sp. S2]|nr:hypothetical protein GGI08_001769 [Coemansia sp. S2]